MVPCTSVPTTATSTRSTGPPAALIWQRRFESYPWPVVAGDTLYVGADFGNIYALDGTAGAVIWQYEGLTSSIQSAPAFDFGAGQGRER